MLGLFPTLYLSLTFFPSLKEKAVIPVIVVTSTSPSQAFRPFVRDGPLAVDVIRCHGHLPKGPLGSPRCSSLDSASKKPNSVGCAILPTLSMHLSAYRGLQNVTNIRSP